MNKPTRIPRKEYEKLKESSQHGLEDNAIIIDILLDIRDELIQLNSQVKSATNPQNGLSNSDFSDLPDKEPPYSESLKEKHTESEGKV